MSTNLYWEIKRPSRGKTLGDGLKWAIAKYYGRDRRTFTRSDIGFLRGVMYGQFDDNSEVVRDCHTLINAIDEHEEIEVWIAE